ncbi:MAG: anthranilate synthase component I family protein [Cryobacterium sp.]|jgi:anthranilate/para-aminobenzoate synthase component I|nr:anthranilate synthase component I family protein [Cryobacterium sp.]
MRRRVISTHLDFWVEPSQAFVALFATDDHAFWLDSGAHATTGMSCLGRGSRVVIERVGLGATELSSGKALDVSVLDFLRREQANGSDQSGNSSAFPLGWVGWLGYELNASTLDSRSPHAATKGVSRYPDAAFMFAERAIVFDHESRVVTLVVHGDEWSGECARWRDDVVAALGGLIDRPDVERDPAGAVDESALSWAYSDDEYLELIRDCQRRIRSGDAYQLCLTTEISIDVHPDPLDTYLRLRRMNPSHHGGFLRVGDVSLVSSSPEQFLTVSVDREVESRPIKGTRRRGETAADDAALRQELVESEKERAENLMIVDLVRNDLSKVCELGSVNVPRLLDVESYAHVHQLVSTVRGILALERAPLDAVVACFPAGSMTGAPKSSAVRILRELERRPRGIYSGAFGYVGLDGSIDLAMVIRSIVLDGDGATIGTGGGITALSVPEEELEETRIKAAALVRVLGLVTL